MENIIEKNKQNQIIAVVLILVIGISVRLFHIGLNGLWFDEIGVANVIYADSILDILRISKSHVMAMPLDYFVVYAFSHIGHTEWILRLPAVLWGCLSIVVLYFFSIEIGENKNCIWTSLLLLAISPILVEYSQEVRFYSSLIFFFLLASWMVVRAIKFSTPHAWLAYFIIMVIGCFFHIYVVFVFILSAIWFGILWFKKNDVKTSFGFYVLTNIAISLIVLAGLYLLTSNQHTGTHYDNIGFVIFNFVVKGLGFLPAHLSITSFISIVMCTLSISVFFLGWIDFAKGKKGVWNQGIAWSIPIMVVIVGGLDLYKSYFIHYRQLIFLVPFVIIVLTNGILRLSQGLVKKNKHARILQDQPIYLVFLSLFVLMSVYGLYKYYQWPKAYFREITQQLHYDTQELGTIYISPPYDVISFMYYYHDQFGIQYAGHLVGVDVDHINQVAFEPGDALIIDPSYADERIEVLPALGLESKLITHPLQNRNDILWLLPDSPDS